MPADLQQNCCVLGDVNARVGRCADEEDDYGDVIGGSIQSAERNDNGDRLLEFCRQFDLCLANTLPRRDGNGHLEVPRSKERPSHFVGSCSDSPDVYAFNCRMWGEHVVL